MENFNNVKRLERRYASLRKQFDQVVESNIKLVDEKNMYKNDIKVLVRYVKYPDLVEKEVIDNIIDYYSRTFKVEAENKEEVNE